MKARKDVQMVFSSINAVKMAFEVFRDAPYITEKILAMVGLEDRHPVFGGKDDVIIDLSIR